MHDAQAWAVAVLLIAAVGAAGCGSTALDTPVEAAQPTGVDRSLIEEHLEVFNSVGGEGRAAGSEGYKRAAEYVAAQFAQYRLQPALHKDYHVPFTIESHQVHAGRFAIGSADSLDFVAGRDFLPDARSDSGSIGVASLVRLNTSLQEFVLALDRARLESFVLVLPPALAGDSNLVRLRNAGIQAVAIEGPLTPGRAVRPVPGLLVLQATPNALAIVEQRLQQNPAARLHVEVRTEPDPFAGAVVVAGYRAGQDPVLSRQLVLVCADLDAMGTIAGVATRDMENFGVGAAALLEAARLSDAAPGWAGPLDRSILFAAISGGRLDHAGLRAYLRRPLWPLDATRAVIYIGLPTEQERTIRELLDPHGIVLFAINPDPARERDGVTLLPEAAAPVGFDLSQTIDRIYPEAAHAVEATGDLLRTLTGAERDLPGDTLAVR